MASASNLERSQWDYFWIPADTTAHERAVVSYLTCPINLPHLNVVTRIEPAGGGLESAVEEVSHAHRSVLSRWQVYSRVDTQQLRNALTAGGYQPGTEHDARVVTVNDYRHHPALDYRVARVNELSTLRDFHTVANAGFGNERLYTAAQLEAQLRQCASPDGRVQRFVVYRGARAVSSGGLNAFDALGFGLLWAGNTIPEARGHGAYSALVSARISWARTRGLAQVGLYAVTTTSSPITAKQGFARYGTMTYWDRGPRES